MKNKISEKYVDSENYFLNTLFFHQTSTTDKYKTVNKKNSILDKFSFCL